MTQPSPQQEPSDPPADGVTREAFREALSYWAAGVTIVAVRDGDDVHGMTVSSLTSVSDRPPTVMISLTRTARILPFVAPGVLLGVSVLAEDQRRVAAVYADSYPVGPSPFGGTVPPLVDGALVALTCRVEEIRPVSGSHVVTARVLEAHAGEGRRPLLYFRREFVRLG